MGEKVEIEKPKENKILSQEQYSLSCKTHYYTDITIGGDIIEESYIKISEGHENATINVNNEAATFFGADFIVLDDNPSYLVMMRYYDVSGLTEVVSINKDTGIGFDIKTLTFGFSGAPNTTTYLINCYE
ncbi:hypothetical protein ACFL3C_00250 [Patescibacteria group bacterium]